jgi:hypothetical protein
VLHDPVHWNTVMPPQHQSIGQRSTAQAPTARSGNNLALRAKLPLALRAKLPLFLDSKPHATLESTLASSFSWPLDPGAW